jgi:hypothetical protein
MGVVRAIEDENPFPARVVIAGLPKEQFHLQAWLDSARALHVRLTDGLRGWEACLGVEELRTQAERNNFRDDGGHEEYLQHTLCSLTSEVARCTFSAAIVDAHVHMRWTRACVIDGIDWEVSGEAVAKESQTALCALRDKLALRLNESASTADALKRSIASIDTQLDRAAALTHDLRERLATLDEDRRARFYVELDEKKKLLQVALHASSDSDSDQEGMISEDDMPRDAGSDGAKDDDRGQMVSGSVADVVGVADTLSVAALQQSARSLMDFLDE